MITNLQQKLNRLAGLPKTPVSTKHDISAALGGTVHADENDRGFIIKRTLYRIGMRYGDCALENIESVFPNTGRLVFIDTETTGLGAGASAFLIGAAYYEDDRLALEQIFLRDIDDEEAALEYIINKFSDMTVVSFNGKSFDVPLIKGRAIINSVASKGFAENQIDLLHLSRRIWKKRLESCRLNVIEEEILRFSRENDINGSLIPDLYKKYLLTGSPDDMVQIVKHNENDIVSLTILLAKLLRIEQNPPSQLDNIRDVMHLGEYYFNQKQYDKAKECLEAVTHEKTDSITLYTAMKYLSLIQKHDKNWDQALYYWQKMAIVNQNTVFPLIELAKYYEHIANDLEKAISCSNKAKLTLVKMCDKESITEINIRIKRLSNKIEKAKAVSAE